MRPMHGQRSGFTIIELLVALTIGALVMIGVRILVDGIYISAAVDARMSRSYERDANGERLLRRLAASAETGTMIGGTFGGDSMTVHFVSWCDEPGGWERRCRVTLGVDLLRSGPTLRARLSTGEHLALSHAARRMSLLYLSAVEGGGTWTRQWGDGPNIPIALGVTRDTDTLIIKLGEQQ